LGRQPIVDEESIDYFKSSFLSFLPLYISIGCVKWFARNNSKCETSKCGARKQAKPSILLNEFKFEECIEMEHDFVAIESLITNYAILYCLVFCKWSIIFGFDLSIAFIFCDFIYLVKLINTSICIFETKYQPLC
jgi:hypothetical protein